MSAASSAESGRIETPGRSRAPAIVPAVAVILGVLCDHTLPLDWSIWLPACGGLLLLWSAAFALKWNERAGGLLVLALFAVGGARHHQTHSIARDDDVSRCATAEAVPVRMIARITSPPVVVPRHDDPRLSAWDRPDRTFVLAECESAAARDGERTISGTVRLQVAGHLLHVQPGDRVEVRGWLARPSPPHNPGEDDFRERLLRYGVRCVVYCEDPAAVRRIDGGRWTFRRPLARFRQRAEELLIANLHDRPLAVAAAMLLGDRTHLEPELRDVFARSATMHVLAISGLHVGMLALFLWGLSRLLRLPPTAAAVVVVAGVILYALITDMRPSVVRATVVIAVVFVGVTFHRRPNTLNALCVAALLLVLWEPAALFDVGAQLSFLSVLGLIAANAWLRTRRREESIEERVGAEGRLKRGIRAVGSWCLQMQVIMVFIWLFALPLSAARFHVVSPIGLLLNTVLVPGMFLVLFSGYALLFGGLFVPALQSPVAAVFEGSLRAMLALIDWGSNVNLGHFYLPGPTDGWLWGYYGLLAAVVWFLFRFDSPGTDPRRAAVRRTGRWLCCAVLAWVAVGLAFAVKPPKPDGLRCTFLSMAHGTGVLIELPDGRTLLYDAGSIGNNRRATETVQSALWARRRSRIDAVVVSHADVDHFNGVPELMRTVPVGTLIVAQPFFEFEQPSVPVLVETAAARGIPIRLVRAGDVVSAGEAVSIRVLHPDRTKYSSDNAGSIVLEIEYAGRRILLTGDLEKEGLERMLSLRKRKVDVLLSPHHGSRTANPKRLADWAEPSHVVASAGRQADLPALKRTYGNRSHVMSTHRSGAVTVQISPRGELRVREFLPSDRSQSVLRGDHATLTR